MTDRVPGIDFERVVPWFSEHVEPVDSLEATIIGHGRSNLTYRLQAGERSWVLRRPPLSHVLPTAHDMRREFRVISAMKGTAVPVPDALALCEDTSVNDAPFYIMSFVEGLVPSEPARVREQYDAQTLRGTSEELVDTLVALHSIDPASVGLSDFGKPQGFVERQVRRFAGQISQHRTRDFPELEELARRLAKAIPEETGDYSIVHGDYRLDNCVLSADGHIAAVLDWEMATLGDPMTDVGLQVMYWARGAAGSLASTPANAVSALPGFLTLDEALQRYGEKSGRSMEKLDFYIVLAYFKLAVIVEGIYARFLEGGTVGAGFEGTGQQARGLAVSGLAVADKSPMTELRG